MCFLGSKFTQNALAARAPPRTPLGELKLKRSPRPFADFRGPLRGRGKGKEGKEVGEKRGIGERKEGGRGEGGGKRRGGRVCVIGVRGIDAPEMNRVNSGNGVRHDDSIIIAVFSLFLLLAPTKAEGCVFTYVCLFVCSSVCPL